jgi:hypothetical protein
MYEDEPSGTFRKWFRIIVVSGYLKSSYVSLKNIDI